MSSKAEGSDDPPEIVQYLVQDHEDLNLRSQSMSDIVHSQCHFTNEPQMIRSLNIFELIRCLQLGLLLALREFTRNWNRGKPICVCFWIEIFLFWKRSAEAEQGRFQIRYHYAFWGHSWDTVWIEAVLHSTFRNGGHLSTLSHQSPPGFATRLD